MTDRSQFCTNKSLTNGDDDMKPEYVLDYRKAKPNRFFGQTAENRVVVLLDPEISEIFSTRSLEIITEHQTDFVRKWNGFFNKR